MVEVLMGKVCSGKSHYANLKEDFVILSVDDVMNALNRECEGPAHHKEIAKDVIESFLYMIVKLDKMNINTILDFGLWYKDDREHIREVLNNNHIDYKFIYFKANRDLREKRLKERNKTSIREIPLERLDFFDSLFEEPDNEEVEVWNMN